jgi:hypothetical protein
MTGLKTIDFIDAPLRGAPLVVLLVTMAAASGLIAGSVAGGGGWALALLVVFLPTLLVSPAWMRLLAERSWPPTPPRPRWFELAGRSIAVLFLAGVLLASMCSWGGLAWALFAAHALFTAVVSLIELRRYPGFLPRSNG